ncbi:hypothetical protein AVEN_261952-1 [Araneus ventricosus]|uniref:Uncharacterized protein n=1 Tax=Araneus ventricosus TaxID=182803 RepID=A0A4Y2ER88_ARAVE|nr:hypothetical protein AVEN_261952-1 [Araneus ventricosus]
MSNIVLYRVPTKVPYHPFNYRIATAIFIRVVSRNGKVTILYWMKPITVPTGGKTVELALLSLLLRNVWFEHDGAPAHKTSSVKQYLVEDSGEHIIGYGGFQE